MRFNLKALFAIVTIAALALGWWKSLDFAYDQGWQSGWKSSSDAATKRYDALYWQWLAAYASDTTASRQAGVTAPASGQHTEPTPHRSVNEIDSGSQEF